MGHHTFGSTDEDQSITSVKRPIDNTALGMSERQGVEIDYCPQCRGVWLDRGELHKIIERSSDFDVRDDRSERDKRDDQRSGGDNQRKKNFLSEIFEFGE